MAFPCTTSRVGFALFLVLWLLVWVRQLNSSWVGTPHWPEGALLALCVAATLTSLARRLPWQNVLLGAAVLLGLAGVVETLASFGHWPFGQRLYSSRAAPSWLRAPAWPMPWIWLVLVLNSREAAGLALRRWRGNPSFGWWRIGVALVLVLALLLGLEVYANQVMGYWTWAKANTANGWYGAPWSSFAGAAISTTFMLVLTAPALLNKKPAEPTPSYIPLAIWFLMSGLFFTAACVHRLWAAAAAQAASAAALAGLAWCNGRH